MLVSSGDFSFLLTLGCTWLQDIGFLLRIQGFRGLGVCERERERERDRERGLGAQGFRVGFRVVRFRVWASVFASGAVATWSESTAGT